MAEDTPEQKAARIARNHARREARAAIPGIFIDTWSVLTWEGHIRVTLGEIIGRIGASYRMAAVMTLDDAEDLANRLLEAVRERREKDAAPAEDDQDGPPPEEGNI